MTRALSREGIGWLALYLIAVGFAAMAHGCGASALRSHATANEIAGVVIETAEGAYLAHLEASSAACEDEPCVLATRAAHASAEATIGLVRVANKAYREAIRIANAAENGDALVPALLTMALRIAALWQDMVAALRALGVDAPARPFPLPGAT